MQIRLYIIDHNYSETNKNRAERVFSAFVQVAALVLSQAMDMNFKGVPVCLPYSAIVTLLSDIYQLTVGMKQRTFFSK